VPGGTAGDGRLAGLAAAGIGHATVTRTGANGIDPADLELALRYLPEVRAIVLVRPDAALLPAATAAASWTTAGLVIIGAAGAMEAGTLDAERPGPFGTGDAAPRDEPGSGPIVLDPPASDREGAFAGFVAALAVRLDAGEAARAAWSSTVAALAIDPVS
jgi:hypothetical protein